MNAPQYIVTNGTLYMQGCTGAKLGTKEGAYRWSTEKAASSQALQLNRREKTTLWHVEEIEGACCTLQSFDTTTLAIKSAPEFQEMVSTLYACVKSMETVKQMTEKCVSELSQQDKLQEDLLHKIEFESCGRGQGAHLCSMLRKCRQKRRGYKDMLSLLQSVSDSKISGISVSTLQEAQAKFDTRTYETRTTQVF